MPVIPPVIGTNIEQWGREVNLFLYRNLGRIFHKSKDDKPSDNGIFLWDESKGYPVVSSSGSFRQLALKQPTPAASTGSAGDTVGMIAWDTNYIYICTADYTGGGAAIWERVALSTW